MYDIVNEPMTPEFLECWRAAAMHLDRQVPGGMQSWMRSHPFPPYLEHLSFRIGNQLYFARVEDVDKRSRGRATPTVFGRPQKGTGATRV